ncbi:hypothetical protein AXK11_03310 [Cephaloticoccus primus]|uniref:TfoX N-terminal domain-containing protein n=1 Tax=Cephaloticoccus primus TaxID=1548207 RepID=A0A139SQF1_9BACT|nr:hypothetical protein [Cephaloticoccus primus]KXU36835.1 hypothetical protein AXK11_03310 [Cephaloticoccus primus]
MKAPNRHRWLLEPLEDEPTLLVRSMFSGLAVYLDGRMVLYLADRAEPWRGICVPMELGAQPQLIADCPALAPHPQLGKWLYLPESADSFERDAQWLVSRIRARDPRIGITPPLKKRPKARPN